MRVPTASMRLPTTQLLWLQCLSWATSLTTQPRHVLKAPSFHVQHVLLAQTLIISNYQSSNTPASTFAPGLAMPDVAIRSLHQRRSVQSPMSLGPSCMGARTDADPWRQLPGTNAACFVNVWLCQVLICKPQHYIVIACSSAVYVCTWDDIR